MLRRLDLDFFLVAMPFTLLDQAVLDEEFPLCAERGVGVVVGSPFASGVLATGADAPPPMYDHLPATPEALARTRAIEAVRAEFGVPLKAAAFRFPLLHPLVASAVSGAATPAQSRENAGLVGVPIPPAFWAERRDRLPLPNSPDRGWGSIAPGFAGTPLTAYRKPMEVLRWMTVSAEEPRPRLRAGSGG